MALSRVVSMLEPGGGRLQLNRFMTTDNYVVIVKTEYKLVKKTEDFQFHLPDAAVTLKCKPGHHN